jgi:hypothetical protein
MSRHNAPSSAPAASGTWPRAANGQQSVSLGLLAGDLPELGSHVRELILRRPASVGYRRCRSCRAPRCRYPGRPAARPRRPAFAVVLAPASNANSSASRGSPTARPASPLLSCTQSSRLSTVCEMSDPCIKGRLRSRCSCRPGARRRTSSLATSSAVSGDRTEGAGPTRRS